MIVSDVSSAPRQRIVPSIGQLFEPIARHSHIFVAVSTLLLIWIGVIYYIAREHQQTETSAVHSTSNLARALEDQLIRSLRAADQTLLYVRDSYSRSPDGFDISLWSQNSQFLSDFSFQVAIINAQGILVASNIGRSQERVDLSDRDHFRVHVGKAEDELFISRPVMGRISKRWSLQVTRRINMPDGSFGGVVVVSLDPDYLSRLYQSIDLGARGSVSVVGLDGIVRARGANGDVKIGESIAGGQLFNQLAKAPSGTMTAKSALDGTEKVFAYRTVQGYPLIVVVALASQELFQQFVVDRKVYLTTAVALTLWIAIWTAVMIRHQRNLAGARESAEAGTRARSEFLAMMSHEIRTPMNGVVGMADLLMDTRLSVDQLKLAATLKQSASHLLQIINDVLDFSKLEADRVELEKIPFSVAEMIGATTGTLEPRAREKGLSLEVDIGPDVPTQVIGDPARLRQVLFNLIGNGLKFTQAGSVSVAVRARPGENNDIALLFSVTDTGIGMPSDASGFLFREFSQLDRSVARRFGGTGLGLAICKRLVALMGGSISAHSKLGAGSCFEFSALVKACHQSVADVGEPTPSLAPYLDFADATSKPRILLVEDNETNQMVALGMLRSLGLDAAVASNGVQAVSLCTSAEYDIILMDVMMPEMDGLAATRAIRGLSGSVRNSRIIALTANAMKGDEEACRRSGMDAFLAKPFNKASLAAVLGVGMCSDAGRAIDDGAAFDPAVYENLASEIGTDGAEAVLSVFLSDTTQRLEKMRRMAQSRDRAGVTRELHSTKSSAATLGFLRLARLAREMEGAAAGLTDEQLEEDVAVIAAEFEASCLTRDTRKESNHEH